MKELVILLLLIIIPIDFLEESKEDVVVRYTQANTDTIQGYTRVENGANIGMYAIGSTGETHFFDPPISEAELNEFIENL